jgi:hypothetical protein
MGAARDDVDLVVTVTTLLLFGDGGGAEGHFFFC